MRTFLTIIVLNAYVWGGLIYPLIHTHGDHADCQHAAHSTNSTPESGLSCCSHSHPHAHGKHVHSHEHEHSESAAQNTDCQGSENHSHPCGPHHHDDCPACELLTYASAPVQVVGLEVSDSCPEQVETLKVSSTQAGQVWSPLLRGPPAVQA
ncbi:MAG: hypothetical protein KDA78_11745 [Planctomycetaceae bacterium]|nr:hypothetical protein [Planctomycetaceae bacterium]